MRLSSIKIGYRLSGAFALLIFGLLLMTVVGVVQMAHMNRQMDSVVNVDNRKIDLATTMGEQVHVLARLLRSVLLTDDVAQRSKELEQIKQVAVEYDKAWQAFNKMDVSERERELLMVVESAKKGADPLNERVTSLVARERMDTARHVLNQMAIPLTQAWPDSLEELVRYQHERSAASYQAVQRSYRQGTWILLAAAGIGIVLAIVTAIVIIRSVTEPIKYLHACAMRMADGDLSQPVERRRDFDGNDETSHLVRAMQRMHTSLSSLVAELNAGAGRVAEASREISGGNSDLSSRTERQAANLQQTAASMDQFSSTIRQTADNAAQAAQLAANATDVAADGGNVMQQAVSHMHGIQASAKKIAERV